MLSWRAAPLIANGWSLLGVSGKCIGTVHQLAALGIDSCHAETLPAEKVRIIRGLGSSGRRVCYVSDGINDAIALREEHASVSLSGATSIARDTAQIILLDGSLGGLPEAIRLGRRFQARMRRALTITVVPTGVALGGVFLLHFGLWQTVLLNQRRSWAASCSSTAMTVGSGSTGALLKVVEELVFDGQCGAHLDAFSVAVTMSAVT